jgi:uncharacterized protein (TIGR03083 family)
MAMGPEDRAPADGQVADPLEALRAECEEVSKFLPQLTEEDYAKPTRCSAWNVKELMGHIYRDIDRINTALSSDPQGEVTDDSVSYWRAYDPVAEAPDIAERAKERANTYPAGRDLAVAWEELWPGTIRLAEGTDPARLVQTWGPVTRFDEYLKTRVLEVTVHRMDMEDALGRKGWGTDLAVSIVDEILEGLLGEQPPSDLDWDVVDFIEAGTGRRQLTEGERAVLGSMADRFPLLG